MPHKLRACGRAPAMPGIERRTIACGALRPIVSSAESGGRRAACWFPGAGRVSRGNSNRQNAGPSRPQGEYPMADLARTDALFFAQTGMDRGGVEKIVEQTLDGMDDGELFLEYSQSESLAFDDGRIKAASFDTAQGFGLRALSGEAAGYAHASELSEAAIRRAADTVRAVKTGHSGSFTAPPIGTNPTLYTHANPLSLIEFGAKAKLLAEIDA